MNSCRVRRLAGLRRIETKVNEALEEMQEREKRRMNVVFVNVPERDAGEREKKDECGVRECP